MSEKRNKYLRTREDGVEVPAHPIPLDLERNQLALKLDPRVTHVEFRAPRGDWPTVEFTFCAGGLVTELLMSGRAVPLDPPTRVRPGDVVCAYRDPTQLKLRVMAHRKSGLVRYVTPPDPPRARLPKIARRMELCADHVKLPYPLFPMMFSTSGHLKVVVSAKYLGLVVQVRAFGYFSSGKDLTITRQTWEAGYPGVLALAGELSSLSSARSLADRIREEYEHWLRTRSPDWHTRVVPWWNIEIDDVSRSEAERPLDLIGGIPSPVAERGRYLP